MPRGRWKPGESGNPKGGKPGPHKPTVVRDMIQEIMLREREVEMSRGEGKKPERVTMTNLEAVLLSALNLSMKGDAAARSFLFDRWLGRSRQPVDFGDSTGEGLRIIIQGYPTNGDGNGNGKGELTLTDGGEVTAE